MMFRRDPAVREQELIEQARATSTAQASKARERARVEGVEALTAEIRALIPLAIAHQRSLHGDGQPTSVSIPKTSRFGTSYRKGILRGYTVEGRNGPFVFFTDGRFTNGNHYERVPIAESLDQHLKSRTPFPSDLEGLRNMFRALAGLPAEAAPAPERISLSPALIKGWTMSGGPPANRRPMPQAPEKHVCDFQDCTDIGGDLCYQCQRRVCREHGHRSSVVMRGRHGGLPVAGIDPYYSYESEVFSGRCVECHPIRMSDDEIISREYLRLTGVCTETRAMELLGVLAGKVEPPIAPLTGKVYNDSVVRGRRVKVEETVILQLGAYPMLGMYGSPSRRSGCVLTEDGKVCVSDATLELGQLPMRDLELSRGVIQELPDLITICRSIEFLLRSANIEFPGDEPWPQMPPRPAAS